jgi:hypothetical protein
VRDGVERSPLEVPGRPLLSRTELAEEPVVGVAVDADTALRCRR